MKLIKSNQKSNITIKEKRKKSQNSKIKTLSDESRVKKTSYSQNAVAQKPVHFRPTSKQKEFLDSQEDKSKTIREAIDLLIETRMDPRIHLDKMCIKYPLVWRSVNRRNGLFLKYKIKELKNDKKVSKM